MLRNLRGQAPGSITHSWPSDSTRGGWLDSGLCECGGRAACGKYWDWVQNVGLSEEEGLFQEVMFLATTEVI